LLDEELVILSVRTNPKPVHAAVNIVPEGTIPLSDPYGP
jgi:hypothetical protein